MDTRTSYLGLRLEHPFVVGASPLAYDIDSIKRLEDAGWAAVVLHSLFEEQITQADSGRIGHLSVFDREFAEILSSFPQPSEYPLNPDQYAEHIYQAKRSVAIPVIASLNGQTSESWLKFAKVIEEAGADALELNMYEVRADLSVPGIAFETRMLNIVKHLKGLLKIPLAVKLSPFFTAFGHMARELDGAGADGLVLFNRFYQPDIDIHTMSVSPIAELSTSAELLLRLRWVAILHGRVRPSLALTGGVATPDDGIKAVLAGADVVQLVSAVLRNGPTYVTAMRQGLEDWMRARQFTRFDEARGAASLERAPDATAFERAHYIRTLHSRR